ncbi:HEAT repeat-containing protein 3-like [Liolophura sinensis]|uniref:HEAT repeat-containing protein 3-like n=1 Tax=Liolophura sinensis TaxID=3198878 RepID=UPI003158B466
MGKTKQKKYKAPKPLPTGLPSVRDFEREEAANGEVEVPGGAAHTVAYVVDKLTSPSAEEREYACTAIATCVTHPEAISALLRLDGIRGLAPLIVDSNHHIRQSALGALRNISVDGGPDVCKKLVLKDVLTPLIALLNEYGVDWIPEHSQAKRKADVKVEIYTQAVHLLANLCESTELAVTVFNKENLGRFLLPCLNTEKYGFPLAVAAAQCLYSVSEDNPESASFYCENQSTLESVVGCDPLTPGLLLLRTLAIGILCNSNSQVISQASGGVVVAMVTKLTEVLTQDPVERLKSACEKLNAHTTLPPVKAENGENVAIAEADPGPGEEETEVSNGPAGDGQANEKMEEEPVASSSKQTPPSHATKAVDICLDLEEVQYLLTAQQVALELLTNLCVGEDEGEDWEDMDSSSSSDDLTCMDTNMADTEVDNNNMFNTLCLPTEVHTAFTSNDLLDKVLSKANVVKLPADIVKALEDREMWKSIVKSLQTVQSHALLCINNLVTCLTVEALGGVEKLHKIWLGLLQTSTPSKGLENSSLLEAVTSAMRAVIQKMAGLETNKFSEVKGQELEFIFQLGQTCPVSQVRANSVRIISTIGCILATATEPHPGLKDIGLFLVGVACQDTDLWVTAEALDSIFDVFGEDHLDPILKEIGMIDKLKKLDPVLKSKMSSQRKQLGEHYPVIYTAKRNLGPFIKYKTTHLAGSKS